MENPIELSFEDLCHAGGAGEMHTLSTGVSTALVVGAATVSAPLVAGAMAAAAIAAAAAAIYYGVNEQ